jgi:DNA (cytosine-5)-methyltransferase 1
MRVLDLFCGPGGAARGYLSIGCDVQGIDNEPQPLYPSLLIRADVLDVLATGTDFDGFDLVHAAPPAGWPMIGELRVLLDGLGIPYIIEGPGSAPLRNRVMLCGTMLDRAFRRHRYFESTLPLIAPRSPCEPHRPVPADERIGWELVGGIARPNIAAQMIAVGLDPDLGFSQEQIDQTTPPVYARWIGSQVVNLVDQGGRG